MKKECTSCGMEVNEKETVCPICGYEFPVQRSYRVWLIILLAILLLLMSLNWLRPLLHR